MSSSSLISSTSSLISSTAGVSLSSAPVISEPAQDNEQLIKKALFEDPKTFSSSTLALIESAKPKITKLNLSEHPECTDEHLAIIAKECKNVRALALGTPPGSDKQCAFTTQGLRSLTEALPLQTLSLSGSLSFPNASLSAIAQLPSLKHLIFRSTFSRKLKLADISFLPMLYKIQTLVLHPIDDTGLTILSQCSSLTHLSVKMKHPNADNFESILKCKKLRSLAIHSDFMSDSPESFLRRLSKMPLHTLILTDDLLKQKDYAALRELTSIRRLAIPMSHYLQDPSLDTASTETPNKNPFITFCENLPPNLECLKITHGIDSNLLPLLFRALDGKRLQTLILPLNVGPRNTLHLIDNITDYIPDGTSLKISEIFIHTTLDGGYRAAEFPALPSPTPYGNGTITFLANHDVAKKEQAIFPEDITDAGRYFEALDTIHTLDSSLTKKDEHSAAAASSSATKSGSV